MNGEVRQELRKLYNRWYKGDPLVVNSQSTMISHTKTYARHDTLSAVCFFGHVFLLCDWII
ncbi:hypothetical protein E2C01_102773 [Portunus trituberculatus]|uniref:Uncharacterized protein n=1 Tax=Portunus trituberculatus TaxID=210409 RepID=A0A5B7KJA3_PORTR|nr:hypothetical protein [Portunus trituberculatus]